MCRLKKGFTLIELLVVLSVIALLFSVLIPALRVSRQKGTSLVCTSNLRQLGLACQIYSQENDRYPAGFVSISAHGSWPPGNPIGDFKSDWCGWWWFHFISDTIGDDAEENPLLRCPDSKTLNDNLLFGNYGINYSISKIRLSSTEDEFRGQPAKPTQVKTPSRVYQLMDSGYALVSWKAAMEDPELVTFDNPKRIDSFYIPGLDTNKDRLINEKQTRDAIEGRHSRMLNVAYADGHVDSIKVSKWRLYQSDEAAEQTTPPSLSSWRGR